MPTIVAMGEMLIDFAPVAADAAGYPTLPLCGVHRHPGSASDKPLYLRNKAGRGRGIYPRITKESRQNACSPKEA